MFNVEVVAGFSLLAFGRKLFWMVVGGMGFIAGIELAEYFFGDADTITHFIIGVIIGLIGAFLAVVLENIAILVTGFFAGAYFVIGFFDLVSSDSGGNSWVFLLVGGIIGAILMALSFEWGLIILSSMVGSLLIALEFTLPNNLSIPLFFVLFVIGIMFQRFVMVKENK